MYTCSYEYMCIDIYIYMHGERERGIERERESERDRERQRQRERAREKREKERERRESDWLGKPENPRLDQRLGQGPGMPKVFSGGEPWSATANEVQFPIPIRRP